MAKVLEVSRLQLQHNVPLIYLRARFLLELTNYSLTSGPNRAFMDRAEIFEAGLIYFPPSPG